MQRFLLILTYSVGTAALLLAGIVGYEGFRETRRLNAEIETLKAALAANGQPLQPVIEESTTGAEAEIAALKNRIAILEEVWRTATPGTDASVLPPLQSGEASDTSAAPDEDCIPVGTRFLAMVGDSFDICGADARVGLTGIGAADAAFAGGGVAPLGGQSAIEGTDCIVSLLTADAANGFAELRVTCT